jgi:hypothetical protein
LGAIVTAIEAAYESAKDRLHMSLADFAMAVQSCEIYPVQVNGQMAGAMIVKDSEIHACILPWAHGRWFLRPQARIVNAIIKKHGFATTTATTESGKEFVKRLGFFESGEGYRKEVAYGH